MTLNTAMRFVFTAIGVAVAGAVVWRWQTNGWGSLIWLASLLLMAAIRAPFAKQTRENTITEKHQIVVERVLLAIMAIGTSVLPAVHLVTGALGFANYSLPHWATGVGAAILAPAYWLFWRSHVDLGHNWSVTVELREGHDLVTSGIYKRIRHPMYAAIWLIVITQPLLIHNWIAGPAAIIAFGLMYFIRVPYEEAMMRKQFGHAYEAYCERSAPLWSKRL